MAMAERPDAGPGRVVLTITVGLCNWDKCKCLSRRVARSYLLGSIDMIGPSLRPGAEVSLFQWDDAFHDDPSVISGAYVEITAEHAGAVAHDAESDP